MSYWDEDLAYHRGCGGTVKHLHIRATYLDPPEDWLECSTCGDIGDDEVSESPQEPCEGCGKVLTDCGISCRRCDDAEEEGGGQGDQETVGVGGDCAAAGGRSS